MKPDIKDEEFWNKLILTEESIPSNWNTICLNSIQKEKTEIAKRYNIRFENTEIYCNRCERPVGNPNKHICADIRLEALRNQQEEKQQLFKEEEEHDNRILMEQIKSIGRTKTATFLKIKVSSVNRWIDRGKIPHKYHREIFSL